MPIEKIDQEPKLSQQKTEVHPTAIELISTDENVSLFVSQNGGQVVAGTMKNEKSEDEVIIFPIPNKQLHSISKDPRPINPNSDQKGETTLPGGSFLSVQSARALVHGPLGAPWFRYKRTILDGSAITLSASSPKDFFPNQNFDIVRTMRAVSTSETTRPAIVLQNVFTNRIGHENFLMRGVTEHLYLASSGGRNKAAILPAIDKEPVLVEDLPYTGDKPRNNYIDSRIGPEFLAEDGICVFLPEGRDGHVITVEAYMIIPGSTRKIPVTAFCIYRDVEKSQWTAIEPKFATGNIPLQDNESLEVVTTIHRFTSIDEYRTYKQSNHQVI